MLNNPNSSQIQFSWQSLLWRLALTALLLTALAGSSVTFLGTVTNTPNAQVLPTLTHDLATGTSH